MNALNPIYTEKRECQDCYKCIRECPVKAIRVSGGFATVSPEMCILCGRCVASCPNGAKRVRDDLTVAKSLLVSGRKVIASVAPSFVAEFPGVGPKQLIRGLKQLGFYAVSETALGAQQVSASIGVLMKQDPPGVWISSACPTVVEYIRKYKPECLSNISSLFSPVLAHCKMLRAAYGDDIGIVFIGPCIAKKIDAEQHPELLDVVLTFEDLTRWFGERGINLADLRALSSDHFEPEEAREGALYPIEGGMIPGHLRDNAVRDSQYMAFSGLRSVGQAIQGIPDWKPEHNIFLELTACAGSCVNGPKSAHNRSIARKRYEVIKYSKAPDGRRRAPLEIPCEFEPVPVLQNRHTEMQVREALRSVGKTSLDDELNCGGCGYDSCRQFADALIDKKAERMMCATYMRKLAQKKANALLKKMPSAVVIVDEKLKIVECNQNFIRMFPAEPELGEAFPPGLEGVALEHIIPFSYLFERVIETGEDIVGRDIRYQRNILNGSIFTIDPNSVVGGIFLDITEPQFQKEQIIERAREVVQRNLKTVQQIAYLLGENAAESEITLNTIVQSFSPKDLEESSD
jgi:iron only hydrogenase large subunit-like protein